GLPRSSNRRSCDKPSLEYHDDYERGRVASAAALGEVAFDCLCSRQYRAEDFRGCLRRRLYHAGLQRFLENTHGRDSRRADGDWHHAHGRLSSSNLSTDLHNLSDCCPDHHAPAEDRGGVSGGRGIAKGHKGRMGPQGLKTERTPAAIEKASKRGIIFIGPS